MTDLPIKTIEISDAAEKYRRCLRKANYNFNSSIDTKEEAEKALECILAGLSIDDVQNEDAQKILRQIDAKSSVDNRFDGKINQAEITAAKNILVKKHGAMKALSWIILQDPQNYFVPDFKVDPGRFQNRTGIEIKSHWVSSWKKQGLSAVADGGGIKITGSLENDCENYTWITNQKLPQGEKYLTLDIKYLAKEGAWGKRCMFALQINDKYVRPINVNSQPDGFINQHNGTLIFSVDAFDSIDTLSIKTFAGKEISLKIQNIRVVSTSKTTKESKPVFTCQVNQVGYARNSAKRALLSFSEQKKSLNPVRFEVIDQRTGKTEYSGSSSSWKYFAPSGQTYAVVDFTKLSRDGLYTIEIPAQLGITEKVRSFDFEIKKSPSDIYGSARNAAINAYQDWLCGEKGKYKCHTQDKHSEVFGTRKKMDVSGGWHDAGDYGKYSVNAAYTLGMLMLGKEYFPKAFANLKLEEILKPELEWLLKMQRSDGAVYHKACSREWPQNEVQPEADLFEKSVMPISTTATADFAAVMAQAGRTFKNNEYLKAAQSAWSYLEKHPGYSTVQPTYNGKEYGGPYIDEYGNDQDERLWAAVELWRTTQVRKYENYVSKRIVTTNANPQNEKILDWQSVNFFAYYSYYLGNRDKGGVLKLYLKSYGDFLMELTQKNPYGISITGKNPGAFDWGSNAVIATGAFQLLLTSQITGDTKYKERAVQSLDYLFGLNPLNRSYITGFGDNSPKNPHYRPSMSGSYPLPKGFLIGGPNSVNMGGDVPLAAVWNKPPYLRYVDSPWSWATNEVAINWNAPLVNVLSILAQED